MTKKLERVNVIDLFKVFLLREEELYEKVMINSKSTKNYEFLRYLSLIVIFNTIKIFITSSIIILVNQLNNKDFFLYLLDFLKNKWIILIGMYLFLVLYTLILFSMPVSLKNLLKSTNQLKNSIVLYFTISLDASMAGCICIVFQGLNYINTMINCIIMGIFIGNILLSLTNAVTFKNLQNSKFKSEIYNMAVRRKAKILIVLFGGTILLLASFIILDYLGKPSKEVYMISIIIIIILIVYKFGIMYITNTIWYIIVLLFIDLKKYNSNEIFKLLPIYFNTSYVSGKKFTHRLLRKVMNISPQIATELSFLILNERYDSDVSINFLAECLNEGSITVDMVVKEIYRLNLSDSNFLKLTENLNFINKTIFKIIFELTFYESSRKRCISKLNEIIAAGINCNSRYTKLIKGYIELLNMENINDMNCIVKVSTEYDLLSLHKIIDDNLKELGLINEKYISMNLSVDRKISYLMEMNKITSGTLRYIDRSVDNPSKNILINIFSNFRNIIDNERSFIWRSTSIDLKILASKVYYERKDVVKVPFVIINNSYKDIFNISIIFTNYLSKKSMSSKKVLIDKVSAKSSKEFTVVLKTLKQRYMKLNTIIQFSSEELENIREVFMNKIAVEKINKEYVEVEDKFITGTVVTDKSKFIGREKIINNIKNNIHHVNFIIPGHRRSGKTSLLFKLKNGILGDDVYTVFFDIQQLSIYEDKKVFINAIKTIIRRHLESVGYVFDEYNVIGDSDYGNFKLFMDTVSELIKDKLLVLIFDEFEFFQELLDKYGSQFERTIRSILIDYTNIKFIFSGFLSIYNYSFWSEISMVSKFVELNTFTLNESKQLFDKYLNDAVVIDDLAIERIHMITNGHPYLLQCFGSELVKYINKVKDSYILIEEVDEIKSQFIINDNPYLKWMWYSLMDSSEQEFLKERILEKEKNEDIKIFSNSHIEIVRRLSKEKGILQYKLDDLQFTIPLLYDWILVYVISPFSI